MFADKQNRTCAKCGIKDSENNLFQFPKPGARNALRCEAWIRFTYPDKAWHDINLQKTLHFSHKMLCSKHFKSTSFTDVACTKLHRNAIPGLECDKIMITNTSFARSLPAPVLLDPTLLGSSQSTKVNQQIWEIQNDGCPSVTLTEHKMLMLKTSECCGLTMSAYGGEWCLIESDPGVFTQLIRKFGASGVQVEEIWSMDDAMFTLMRPVHGIIFLFKYMENEPTTGSIITNPTMLEKIYFMKQVINNACATQAVLAILLNCEHPDLQLGSELSQLKEFSRLFDPQMRGLTISNSQAIRLAHNSMAQQHIFEQDDKSHASEEEAYHFVSYVPIGGRLVELDGLRAGPVDHGPIAQHADWLHALRPVIGSRIHKYREGEIHFNMLAVVSDRRAQYEHQLEELTASSQLFGEHVESEAQHLRMLIEVEEAKMARYDAESARRRHNYLPFILNLLTVLADERKLSSVLEKSRERARRRATKRVMTS